MPLSDLRVIELATVIAAPGCTRHLADFGADVIKVEHPDGGDGTRRMGWRHPDGETLWWKLVGRNKRSIALDLTDDADRAVFLDLCDTADVVVENLRPGRLERLGVGPEVLWARRPSLVVVRVSGFGQSGPDADRPGFATIAEARSGFAALNGSPDGPPTLPPVALTDEVTALVAAFATLVAVRSGVGQVVDVDLLTSMVSLLGPLPAAVALSGEDPPRLGSEIAYAVPRNVYRCADGEWVAVSATSDSVARRLLTLVGLGDRPELATAAGRVAHRREVDAAVADWIARRPRHEVLATVSGVDAAIAPVQRVSEVLADPHLAARGVFVDIDGVPLPGPIARLGATPGRIRRPAPALDADGAAIRAELTDRAGVAGGRPPRPHQAPGDSGTLPGVLEITVDRPESADYVVVRPAGDLDAYTVARFREALSAVANEQRLVIDLSAVPFMDSAGLGALIGGIRRSREADGKVTVFCDRPTLTRLLHTTGFDRIVPVEDTLDGAIAALDRAD